MEVDSASDVPRCLTASSSIPSEVAVHLVKFEATVIGPARNCRLLSPATAEEGLAGSDSVTLEVVKLGSGWVYAAAA